MNKVEMSLDDIIKNSKDIKNQAYRRGRARVSRGGPRGGVGGKDKIRRLSGGTNFKRSPGRRGSGGPRPFRSRSAPGFRSVPYSKGNIDGAWTHDLYDRSSFSRGGSGGSGKLLLSNLDFGVNNNDIQELFSEFGTLLSAKLHYDRSGRSLGTADLVYERRSDAIKALKQYNGVPLDGRPMQIELAADVSSIENRRPSGGRVGGGFRNGTSFRSPRGSTRGGPGGFRRGSGPRPGGGRGGRGGRGGPKPTQEQLDAELDAYIEKMDTTS